MRKIIAFINIYCLRINIKSTTVQSHFGFWQPFTKLCHQYKLSFVHDPLTVFFFNKQPVTSKIHWKKNYYEESSIHNSINLPIVSKCQSLLFQLP